MKDKKLPAIFVSRPVNVKYVSGYTGEDSWLFLTEKGKYFITDPRYTEQAALECPDYRIVEWRDTYGSVAKALAALVAEERVTALGFESDHLTVAQFSSFEEEVKAELIPASGVIEALRADKTPDEIAKLRIACDIASRAFEMILRDIRVGVTEKELAARLSYYMVIQGADTQPYGNILISGPRTSLLHGIPSNRAIEYGDLILMDYGCQYQGYLSDMTRTVVVGKATAKQREVYALEHRMVEATLEFLKDGVSAADAYRVGAKVLEGTDYLPYHYTGVGHGVGMFVHELPFMSPKSQDTIHAGNVITVEPGIYIPGWGGVRIEDQIIITKDGYENLISAPKDVLIEL